MPASDRWLIIGLGNPGSEYAGNRHNVGSMVVDLLAQRGASRFKSHKTRADVVEGLVVGAPGSGSRVVLAKPRSFMNESGGPVAALRSFFAVPVERIIVVHDELDIAFGDIRVKRGGGDNGHNGLKSITQSLGDRDYLRVRIGIGRPPGRMDPADFVLRDFARAERTDLDAHLQRAVDVIESLIVRGLDATQNSHH